MAAASALMLTACTSEDEVLQSSAPQKAEAKALGFDVYLPQVTNVTRAGDPVGAMTTDKLKTPGKGFGVFAMYQDGADYATATFKPDFMFNEQVHWSSGWTYSPLKYWPNETIQDSQSSNATTPGSSAGDPVVYTCDKVSFFAYAPYVDLSATDLGTGKMTTALAIPDPVTPAVTVDAYTGNPAQTSGILSYSKENRANDPLVEWKYSTDLDQNVDLLWGVAPNGMSYQSVNPNIYINKTFGLPLTDMVKPDKDQKIKFLFNHALSRIGLSVVSAIDQVAAGDDGAIYSNAQTRVLIKSVDVYGDFGMQGVLNLNNATANVANWIAASVDKASVSGAALYSFTVANGAIAKDLRYEGLAADGAVKNAANAGDAATAFAALNKGVLPSEQTLLAGGADPSKKVESATPAYEFGKVLYHKVTNDYVIATTTATEDVDTYTKDASDNFTQVKTAGGGAQVMDGSTKYYKLTASEKTATGGDVLAVNDVYYTRTGSAGSYVYTKHVATATIDDGSTYYVISGETELTGNAYTTDTYYTGLVPRYFMVIPTGATPVKVKITYAVATYDAKLGGYCSDVENDITKQISVDLKSGKSYNLKLILGLTSVKLDASVSDWQVADDAEVFLPKNNE